MASKATVESESRSQGWERLNSFLSKYGIVLILLAMLMVLLSPAMLKIMTSLSDM